MRWRFWQADDDDTQRAQRAKVEAERRLREVRREWPQVREAHDHLSEWIEQALRGRSV